MLARATRVDPHAGPYEASRRSCSTRTTRCSRRFRQSSRPSRATGRRAPPQAPAQLPLWLADQLAQHRDEGRAAASPRSRATRWACATPAAAASPGFAEGALRAVDGAGGSRSSRPPPRSAPCATGRRAVAAQAWRTRRGCGSARRQGLFPPLQRRAQARRSEQGPGAWARRNSRRRSAWLERNRLADMPHLLEAMPAMPGPPPAAAARPGGPPRRAPARGDSDEHSDTRDAVRPSRRARLSRSPEGSRRAAERPRPGGGPPDVQGHDRRRRAAARRSRPRGGAAHPRPAGHVLPARLYAASGGGAPALVVTFFHGGGWVSATSTRTTACARDRDGGRPPVVSVDYRLAPENPFPAAVEDALAATGWSPAPDGLGHRPRRLVVAGDSAGGNLAAVCVQAFTGQRRGGDAPGARAGPVAHLSERRFPQ